MTARIGRQRAPVRRGSPPPRCEGLDTGGTL